MSLSPSPSATTLISCLEQYDFSVKNGMGDSNRQNESHTTLLGIDDTEHSHERRKKRNQQQHMNHFIVGRIYRAHEHEHEHAHDWRKIASRRWNVYAFFSIPLPLYRCSIHVFLMFYTLNELWAWWHVSADSWIGNDYISVSQFPGFHPSIHFNVYISFLLGAKRRLVQWHTRRNS